MRLLRALEGGDSTYLKMLFEYDNFGNQTLSEEYNPEMNLSFRITSTFDLDDKYGNWHLKMYREELKSKFFSNLNMFNKVVIKRSISYY